MTSLQTKNSLKPWLHLPFSTCTGNSTSLKLFYDRSKASCTLSQVPLNICNMLQKIRWIFCDIVSAILLLHMQHSGFTIPAISKRNVVLPVLVKMSHVWPATLHSNLFFNSMTYFNDVIKFLQCLLSLDVHGAVVGNYIHNHTLGKILDSDWLRDFEFIRNLRAKSAVHSECKREKD